MGSTSIKARILADMKSAMQSGDSVRRGVTRMLLSELKYAEAALHNSGPLNEEMADNMIIAHYKRLRSSVSIHPEGRNKQLLLAQMAIVADYLPKDYSEKNELIEPPIELSRAL
ncbi:MAG: GatB/YqeY domain-containing protein [Oligoflexales bacterium]|nr:GatB/YqeY domain-containing protein [Oligoflexales bacterium]